LVHDIIITHLIFFPHSGHLAMASFQKFCS